MTEYKSDELKLITEFRTLLFKPTTDDSSIGSMKKEDCINYHEFDFHQEVKNDKFENIDKFISENFLSDLQNYGFFVKKYQSGEGFETKSLNDQKGEI